MTVRENIEIHKERIARAARESGRQASDVELIAVTKTRTVEEINEAIRAGIRVIGENRVQELLEKYDSIDKSCEAHLIGQLQTNKVKYVLDKVTLIHSLDRVSLAEQINSLAEKRNMSPVKVLVEVNIGKEDTKSGILPENLTE